MGLALAGLAITVILGLIPVGLWVSGELTRVRSAVLAAEPKIDGTLGSDSLGLQAEIHNSGEVPAHDLVLSVPGMDNVWQQASLDRGVWARLHIAFPNDDPPLLTTQMDNPIAKLTYADRFGRAYTLTISLTQTLRGPDPAALCLVLACGGFANGGFADEGEDADPLR
jgi:hypothetical protein